MSTAKNADVVVYAKVKRHVEPHRDIFLAMDLEIIKVIKGQYREANLRVWGDNGILCRPYVMAFPENTEWVFVFYGDPKGAALSICGGENWLRVENGRVYGNIEGTATYQLDLVTLIARFPVTSNQRLRHAP